MSDRSHFSSGPDHIRLRVRLTPRAPSDRIDGPIELSDGNTVLAARVRAIASDGKANAAVARLIAEALGVPRNTVSIASGHKSRLKNIRVEGDPSDLLDLAQRLWPSLADKKEDGS